ncbi:MAG: hypothetical protein R3E88_07900 [Myxococcota bacterium]|nr:hypothetical protein [Myxococcales bacterium]
MPAVPSDPRTLLRRALEGGRIHSGYLLSGATEPAREAALWFARALVCRGERDADRPCEACGACARSGHEAGDDGVEIDGTGRSGPFFRHVGDHPDLYWVDRGADGTRVRIGQVRALQRALRLGANEGGRCVAVIADAEWLNTEAQNALLRLLEEPPADTTIVLVAASAAALLATIRSRCQRVAFPVARTLALRGDDASESVAALAERLDGIARLDVPALLDWAEEVRGERAASAELVRELLATGSEWLRERATARVRDGAASARAELDAFATLKACRRDLAQRNANPQMVAERALLALHAASRPA